MKVPNFIQALAQNRAKIVIGRILPYIKHSKRIVDISNKSLVKTIKPIIYDGKHLPFPDQSFDASLLLMVLHHTPDPKIVFSEAARVGKELVVIETIYKKLIDKIVTVLFDSLDNLQPRFYWNSYHRDEDWKTFFKSLGYKVEATQYHRDWWFFIPYLHNVYYLGTGIDFN